MTTKFEEKFFKYFGIEPKEEKYCYWECKKPELEKVACNNTGCEHYRHKIYYPQITDTILLDLICILNIRITAYDAEYRWCKDREKLKDVILKDCIYNKELIQREVQKLFKE